MQYILTVAVAVLYYFLALEIINGINLWKRMKNEKKQNRKCFGRTLLLKSNFVAGGQSIYQLH